MASSCATFKALYKFFANVDTLSGADVSLNPLLPIIFFNLSDSSNDMSLVSILLPFI